jgi:hypothetical protein
MRRAAVALLMLGSLLGGTACASKSTKPRERPTAEAAFAPAWERSVKAQEERLARLDRVYASGPVELLWVDEDGRHFETCRGELFVRLPSETALFLKKVGEPVLWLGSDARRRWLFDLRFKEVVLWLVDLDQPAAEEGPQAPFPIRRVALVDLLGLVALPPAESLDAVFDAEPGTLVGEFNGDGGAIRVTVDTATNLPLRVEALDDEGQAFLRGDLGTYETVERPGLPPGEYPRFPQRVVISVLEPVDGTASTSQQASRSEVRLYLSPARQGEERVTDQRFDLQVLSGSFKPARTERR